MCEVTERPATVNRLLPKPDSVSPRSVNHSLRWLSCNSWKQAKLIWMLLSKLTCRNLPWPILRPHPRHPHWRRTICKANRAQVQISPSAISLTRPADYLSWASRICSFPNRRRSKSAWQACGLLVPSQSPGPNITTSAPIMEPCPVGGGRQWTVLLGVPGSTCFHAARDG